MLWLRNSFFTATYFIMFTYNSMFIIFGLFLMFFCDTTLSKCNDIGTCSCIIPNSEAKKLINFIYKGLFEVKEPRIVYADLCTNIAEQDTESEDKSNVKENGLLCGVNSDATEPIELGTVEYTNGGAVLEYKNISVSIANRNFTVNCCTKCNAQFVPAIMYHVPRLRTMDMYKSQLVTNGLSTGSVLVILLFVFSGLYFIGGAIILKLLRGATGWEVLPNHKFWCDLPSLIRDGISFTFSCCSADSYERI